MNSISRIFDETCDAKYLCCTLDLLPTRLLGDPRIDIGESLVDPRAIFHVLGTAEISVGV